MCVLNLDVAPKPQTRARSPRNGIAVKLRDACFLRTSAQTAELVVISESSQLEVVSEKLENCLKC